MVEVLETSFTIEFEIVALILYVVVLAPNSIPFSIEAVIDDDISSLVILYSVEVRPW